MSTSRSDADGSRSPVRLSDLGSGRLATRAVAVPTDPQRFRRPTDVVLLVLSLVVLAVTASAVDDPGDFEETLADWLSSLPGLLDFFWTIVHDFVQIWVLVVAVLALARRRWGLLRDWAISIAVASGGVLFVGWLVDGEVPTLSDSIGTADGAGGFPSLALAAGAAAVAVASPYFVSPLRRFGRWLVATAWLASLVLGVTQPGAGLCALAIGWTAGALVHLLFGSPDGAMTLHDLGEALRSIGVDAQPAKIEVRNGVIVASARTPDDRRLDVNVHGRDSWDSQFFVKMWRLVFYRSGGRNVTVNRRHQIEHQAYLTLYAQREGVLVAPFVAAAIDRRGDALFVTERVGPAFGTEQVDDALLASSWTSLARLHDAGICHGGITPAHLQVADGSVFVGEFDRASIDWDDASRRLDEAQLLTSTAVVVGADRAIAAAVDALGTEYLATTTTFVQPAAMPPTLRRQADDANVDIDDLRKATIDAVGAEEQDLQAIRRFSVGNVVMWILLAIVFSTIVASIQDVGLESIIDAISGASVPILILALIIGQTPRFAGALSTSEATPIPIPYGRLTLLEYAITFVNLAVPSTAARVAVNIRFFQRNGLDRTMAIAVGGLDSVSGFVAQISLLIVIIGFGFGSLNLDIDTSNANADFNGQLLLILVLVLAVGVAVVAFVPKFRNPVILVIKTTWSKIGPLLSSPRRLISVVLANLLVQLLFSLTSYTILVAFGQDVSFADVVLVNVCVALFAGLMPVPGGIGVTAAALTAGYVAIGVDSASAMGAALCYRIITFYIPPCYGYFAMKSLRRQRML